MDDLTVNIDLPGDVTSLDDIAAVATALQAVAHHHRFSFNIRLGQFEVNLNRARRQARQLRADSALGNVVLIPPHGAPAPHMILRLIDRYKHLGNPITTPTSVALEVHH